ncbi:MAG: translational GTPase TypA [Lentimicrobium sp.]|jgi:GTP-binding protein|uniref:translational GTPase TypA n=1 Tax=Lentimicrobium sp. TaxID=2034841 RepID=UPI002600898C|nr:translational GTPase TypA [Lentimicrobium sp.]MCO5256081.1 translational GTPase TypA [Lentimicrobium sp.]HOP13503.1 translational GTPase TypA [Lentimicrobium sp.]HPF66008.1 translational GTPase TypA [Lentimicrobium sp.]HRW70705.1 translational GTPase TypA [Lentimicrobium sp.]
MQNIRNIAIIAHVDHGKTTLVDRILHQVKLFRENQDMGELILDSNDLERERGITILSKNVSVRYKGFKINIIDTPGHSDFGGEVERVLNMADGVLLLVDAFEGPMPQTRFVLQKALALNLKPIVVINKVDKPNCDPEGVQESVFDLMFNLDATEDQLNFPTVFGSSKEGWMSGDWRQPADDISYLLDTIIEYIPAPVFEEGSTQMQITSLDYSSYVGRIAVGRLSRGVLRWGQNVSLIKQDGRVFKSKIKELYVFEGLGKEKMKTDVLPGEICAVLGIDDFEIGDTIADFEVPEALKPLQIDEPTMSMLFTINNSPFYGREGKFVTSRHLRERLFKEIEKNLAMRLVETDSPESLMVYGRGILHLSILVETMRREGYELQLGQPQVIIKKIDGVDNEPVEMLTVHVPEAFSGKVIELVTQRRGEIVTIETKGDRIHLEFKIPSRGIIGLRNNVLTATEGEAIMAHRFLAYEPWKGEIHGRRNGSLIAMETGQAIAYSIDKLQDRGAFFVHPNEDIYAGQVIGEHIRPDDLMVNVTKTKKLTNVRASGSDEKIFIIPAIKFSLEEAMEYIGKDEYLEVTPRSLRLRKIILDEHERKRASKI